MIPGQTISRCLCQTRDALALTSVSPSRMTPPPTQPALSTQWTVLHLRRTASTMTCHRRRQSACAPQGRSLDHGFWLLRPPVPSMGIGRANRRGADALSGSRSTLVLTSEQEATALHQEQQAEVRNHKCAAWMDVGVTLGLSEGGSQGGAEMTCWTDIEGSTANARSMQRGGHSRCSGTPI